MKNFSPIEVKKLKSKLFRMICSHTRFIILTFSFCFVFTKVHGQTTVFSDDFNLSKGSSYTITNGAIGSSSLWSMAKSGADWGAKIDPNLLDLTNDGGGTANTNGWVFAYTPLSGFISPYQSILSSNAGIISWSFNMRTNRTATALAGFTSVSYGLGMVLVCTSNTPNTSGSGYAVVMGGGTNNNLGLIYFTGGLQGTITNIIAFGGITPASFSNYLSVQVYYNPSNNLWTLYDRDDGSSSFADPATGTFTLVGSATNSTGTNTAMSYFGAYWQGSTAAAQNGFIDNITVAEVVYTNFYSKATGNLDDLSNWGSNTDGSGASPANFTAINQVFNIRNNTLPTIGAAWVVSGTNSKIIVGDGTNACNFTIPTNYTVTGTLDVAAAAILTLQNSSYPTFGTLASNSTIVYDGASNQTINAGTYGNLTIQNNGATKLLGGNIILGNNNTFTLVNGVTLTTGTNTITFGSSGNAIINGILQTANTAGFSGSTLTTIVNTNTPTITIGSSSTIVYNGTSSQIITGGTFANLQISNNAASKSAVADITLGNNNTFILDAGVTFNASTYKISFGTTGTANINGIFQTANVFGGCFSGTSNAAIVSTNNPTINLNTGSTVEYTSTSAQTIATANSSGTNGTLTYYNLLISGITGTKTFNANPKIAAGGTFTINTSCVADMGASNMTFGAGCTANIFGTLITQKAVGGISGSSTSVLDNTNTPTISFGASSTIIYNGTGTNQAISASNYINLTIAGSGNKNLNGSTIVAGTLTLSNKLVIGANTLTLNGAFIGSSTNSLKGSNTSNLQTIASTGSLYFDQTTPNTTNNLNNLTVSAGSLTLANNLNVLGTVNAVGSIASGGNLTIKSSSATTDGRITGSNITGNINVERFIPALSTKRYRFLSSPVLNTIADWSGEIFITGGGISAEYSSVGTNKIKSNGFDWTSTGSSSIFGYTENLNIGGLNSRWEAATNASNSLVTGKGYRVFIRGDRSNAGVLDNSVSNQAAVTIISTGTINSGTVNFPVTYNGSSINDGWNLVGNPYASVIDWNAASGWTKTGVSGTIWIYNPSTNTYGNWDGNTITNSVSRYISSGQAFFVRTTSTPTFSCNESVKVANTGAGVFKTMEENTLRIGLTKDSNNADETVIRFMEGKDNEFNDQDDVRKFINSTVNVSSNFGLDKYASVNYLNPTNLTNSIVPISAWVDEIGTYELTFEGISSFNVTPFIFLKDKFLNKTVDLKIKNKYQFEITNDIKTKDDNRFEIVFTDQSIGIIEKETNSNPSFFVYQNTNNDILNVRFSNTSFKSANITIYSSSGAEIFQTNRSEDDIQINIENLSKGVYFINVSNQNGFSKTVKFVK